MSRSLPPPLVPWALERLGIEVTQKKNGEYWAHCPQHRSRTGREDRTPSWSINGETGLSKCFSCHYKSNLYGLVRDLMGKSMAREFFKGTWASSDMDAMEAEHLNISREFSLPTNELTSVRTLPLSSMALFTDPPDYALEDRRIDAFACEVYKVRWDSSTDSWVFPFYDPPSGGLIGWQEKAHVGRRFKNHPPGLKKGSTLFGYHAMSGPSAVGSPKEVALVESPLDAMLLFCLGMPAVALCGSTLSEAQAELLYEFDWVTLALDNDDAGRREHDRIASRAYGFRFRTVRYGLNRAKDVGEMTADDIYSLMGS